jgi:hypothetical protein
MSELDYIGPDELVFNNDIDKGIHSGGFSVNSIMMKSNMSPIMTLNSPDSMIGGSNKVSDLFNDLVVPNWALSYNNRLVGGKYQEVYHDNSESDDDVIHDDLHEKLLDLVKEHNNKNNNNTNSKHTKKRLTKRVTKHLTKKGGTKKNMK